MQCDQLPRAPAIMTSHHDGLKAPTLTENKPFLLLGLCRGRACLVLVRYFVTKIKQATNTQHYSNIKLLIIRKKMKVPPDKIYKNMN